MSNDDRSTTFEYCKENRILHTLNHTKSKGIMTSMTVKSGESVRVEYMYENMLGILLLNEVMIINGFLSYEGEEKEKDPIELYVDCSDVFAWGVSDCEPISYQEIPELFKMWYRDDTFGPYVWCALKRKLMPQKPVMDDIISQGKWCLEVFSECKENPE